MSYIFIYLLVGNKKRVIDLTEKQKKKKTIIINKRKIKKTKKKTDGLKVRYNCSFIPKKQIILFSNKFEFIYELFD